MFIIEKYDKKYNNAINNFIISIYVEEFGFEQHREEIKNHNNEVYIKNGGEFFIAINEDDEIIGTIALIKHNDQEVEIKKLYVRKDYRGKGISKRLYEEVLEICKINKIKKISLSTYDKLERAVSFYLKRRI